MRRTVAYRLTISCWLPFPSLLSCYHKWPETQPRQLVQLRDCQMERFSSIRWQNGIRAWRSSVYRLEKWAKAGQETHLAVAQWRAELADFIREKTESPAASSNPVRPAAFRKESRLPRRRFSKGSSAEVLCAPVAARLLATSRPAGSHRNREDPGDSPQSKALEVPPPIVFGPLEPGRKPGRAILISPGIGTVVALGFAAWAALCPTLWFREQRQVGSGTTSSSRNP